MILKYKFINDPVPYVFKAFEYLVDEHLVSGICEIEIMYVPDLKELGFLIDNGFEKNQTICLSDKLNISGCVDILCHELAHIIHKDHGKKWNELYKKIFDLSQKLYTEAMKKEEE